MDGYITYLINYISRYFTPWKNAEITYDKIRSFLEGIQKLYNGQISTDLIGSKHLERALDDISQRLGKEHPCYTLIHTDLASYYTNHLPVYSPGLKIVYTYENTNS